VRLTNSQKKLSLAIATLISGYRFFFGKNKEKMAEAQTSCWI